MDLRSENNLENRLESVLSHHNAIRKGLNKKFMKNLNLKKIIKNCSRNIKIC